EPSTQTRNRNLATTVLGARNPRRHGLRASRRLHPLQSGETRLCRPGLRRAVQQFRPLCEERFAAGRLGRRSGRYPRSIRGGIVPSGRLRAQNRPDAMPGSFRLAGRFCTPYTIRCLLKNVSGGHFRRIETVSGASVSPLIVPELAKVRSYFVPANATDTF